ncbi:MAG: 3'-5' exonuclease [Actinomycetota bacterium]
MALPRFAVVDLETSGFSTRRHRILQIGLVLVDADGQIHDRWSSLVALRWPYGRVGPTHVHGLTRGSLRDAPRLQPTLDELGRRVDGALLTAHNARFDGGFLARASRRRPPDDPLRAAAATPLCTLRMSRRLDPERERSHRLGDLAERYDVPLDRAHDALADAEATARVLPHLLAEHDIETPGDLVPFLVDTGRQPKRRRRHRVHQR